MRGDIFASGTVLACALAWCSSAFALNPELAISQYAHTSWKIRDGFSKSTITSIAQTPDGYLWLGTELGLLRFDGVRALPWQPPSGQQLPSNNVRSLLVARDGATWIGTDEGLVRWKDGKLTRHELFAGRYVGDLVEDREGSIWATTHFNSRWTLCEIRPARAECHGDDGGAGAGAIRVYEDRTGHLWVGTVGRGNGLWRWKPGARKFYPMPQQANGIQGLSEDGDGALLISLAGGIGRFVDGKTAIAYPFPTSSRQLEYPQQLRDRDGGVWLGSAAGGGLLHFHAGMVDAFAASDGLSADRVYTLFEDREGNIWVATANGLDRFRDVAVATYAAKQGLSNAGVASVLASPDGSIWTGTNDRLNRWAHGRATTYPEPAAIGGIQSIFQDSLGRVWVSTIRETGYLENGRFVSIMALGSGQIRSIVEDGDGNVWIANQDFGLLRVSTRSGDIDHSSWADLKHNVAASAMTANRSLSGVWLGFPQGGVIHFSGGQVRASYGIAEGLGNGTVRGLRLDHDGTVWAATDGGLSRLKDGRVATLTSKNGLPCDAAQWIIDDDAGGVWVAMRCGLARIPQAEIDAWSAAVQKDSTAAPSVTVTVFESDDGFRVSPNASYYGSPVAKSSDGKLWFVGEATLRVVDPRRLPVNSLPPPVHIEQVIADRRPYDLAVGELQLPALTRDLQIDYTALSFVAPEKNRFRIRLDGHDRDWQDVGNRRQAFYNDLTPGSYRFRVMASNNSGVWNEVGAVVDFSIAPAYYQTTWFLALSASTVLALVWGAHRLRLRIVERHQAEITALNESLMKAQEQERTRIAGELHDGVIQQISALSLVLGTAKRQPEADAKKTIADVQRKLIEVGTEVRQLSHGLHPPILQEAGLPQALHAYCEEFRRTSGIPVSCEADDDARDLSRGTALALFRILQEALGNAAKHAHATRITVRLTRSADTVSLAVSDDGAGFAPSRLGTSGGLGLIMMRERATQLNGTFDFESAPGRGTIIRVVIPFR